MDYSNMSIHSSIAQHFSWASDTDTSHSLAVWPALGQPTVWRSHATGKGKERKGKKGRAHAEAFQREKEANCFVSQRLCCRG